MRAEYSWKPPLCEFYAVVGHKTKLCMKRPRTSEEVTLSQKEIEMGKSKIRTSEKSINRDYNRVQTFMNKAHQNPNNGKGQRNNWSQEVNISYKSNNRFEFRPK